MGILNKCLGKMCAIGFAMLCLYFICEFSISAVVSVWNFDFKDELYEINKNGIFLYLGSIMLMLGIFLCLIYISQKYISNKINLFLFIIIGISILIFAVDKWMDWLDIFFSKYQLYDYNIIDVRFEDLFGNKVKAKITITTVIVSFFSFNMLFGNIEIILDGKAYINEAFASKNKLTDNIIVGLAGYLFWPVLSIVNYLNLSNWILVIIMSFMGVLYSISSIVIWRRMKRITKLEKKESVYIVVSEIGEGIIMHQLFKNEYTFIKQLCREGIILISKKEYQKFQKERKNVISLECYTAFYVNESEIQKNHLENAAFHMAFFEYLGNKEELKSFYEMIIDKNSVKEAIQHIVPYCYKVSYKKSLEDKFQKSQYMERGKKNLFVYNYVKIIKNIQNEIDNFQSLKILLNTLEMINYFYALILISYQEWDISSIIQRQTEILTNATFGSWILVRKDFLTGKKQMKKILNNPYNYNKCNWFNTMMKSEICDYELFMRLFQMKETKEYSFDKIYNKSDFDLSSSFDVMNIFRNYTRGHGVYTFEISDELILSLMDIAKFWFLKLDETGFLQDDYSNLEQLGWIFEYQNMSYFFYSYKRDTKELEYHCFLDGSVLFLPYDINRKEGGYV